MLLEALEHALEAEFSVGFSSPSDAKLGTRAQPDLVSDDASIVLSVKTRVPGLRELHSACVQLALAAADETSEHAILALWDPKLSSKSLRTEWERLREVFAKRIRPKLELVALWPDDRRLSIGAIAERIEGPLRTAIRNDELPHRRIEKRQEVLKILLLRWLRNEPPISIKQLQASAGASFPTTSKALAELERYVVREKGRKVSLRSFPREPWIVLTTLAPRLRDTVPLMDASGREIDLDRLVNRLARVREPAVGLGGVHAARHWDTQFDLDGTPRVDISVHAPAGRADLSFLQQVDPGLQRSSDPARTILVVHSLTRPLSLFSPGRPKAPPWVDPVETLLDLTELRLTKQADELIRHMRGS